VAKAQWKVESLSARLTYNNKQSLVDIFPIITRAQSVVDFILHYASQAFFLLFHRHPYFKLYARELTAFL